MGRTYYTTNKNSLDIKSPEKTETFKLTRVRKYDKSKDMLLRAYVPNETYELFCKIAKETNLSLPILSGMCIEYAMNNLELLDPRDE